MKSVSKYQQPRLGRSIWQITNSLIPYIGLWVLAYFSLQVSYFLTLAIAIPAAGFLIRIFIIFHDCVHGSFFKSSKANDLLGHLTGFITYTPYYQWRRSHRIHHDTAGDLDNRGNGDVWTMTTEEYLTASHWLRFWYRFYRNPLTMFVLGPLYVVLIGNRIPRWKFGWKEHTSIHATNLVVAGMVILGIYTIGWKNILLIQLPINIIGFAVGFWLFYVQHQFEGVYWEKQPEWDFVASAMQGSSYYKLPLVLQWFTGRIGFHHIHHLCPRIPNYNLAKCYKESLLFQNVQPITLKSSFKSLSYRLWDKESNRLIGFRDFRRLKKERGLVRSRVTKTD
ncbi:MAG: fatty acid desaturase [candidate division Zixibacteria bacterium]|nr:fatty acid desaturase [candidate division Zixibacteria bacterium]